MVDVRTLAAAVLGIGLGIVLIAFPDIVIQVQTAGRVPHDRGGEYGQETPTADRWRWLVRTVGIGVLVGGLYFGGVVLSVV